MKTIKGHYPGKNVKILNRLENLDKYVPILSRYFDVVCNCRMGADISSMENTFLSFVTIATPMSPCSKCKGGCLEVDDKWNFKKKDSVWEFAHSNKLTPVFLRVEKDEHTHILCEKSLIITIKSSSYNRVIGEFCKGKKILLTSDWTHDEGKVDFVKEILEIMNSSGFLEERKVEKKLIEVTLGTDPEFELEDDDGNIISCREHGIRDRAIKPGKSEGQIGHDGAGHQREIRPDPSPTPEGLISNIEKLIIEAIDENWSMRGIRYPLGGHIHIGNVDVSWDYVELLDYLLRPLTALNSEARSETHYSKIEGNPDRMRPQDWGMEYRVPPSGYLASKDLAYITFKIVKLSAQKHFNGEDIQITDDLKADLETLGLTKDEVKKYFSEIKKFKESGLPRSMKVAWGIKKKEIKYLIEFRDGWNDDVKNFIEEIAKQIFESTGLEGKLVLYGVSSERGNVFSVEMDKMDDIILSGGYKLISPIRSTKLSIGVPNSIRRSISEASANGMLIHEIVLRTLAPKPRKAKTVRETEQIPSDFYSSLSPSFGYVTSSPDGSLYMVDRDGNHRRV